MTMPPPPDWATAGIAAHVAGWRETHDRLPSPETFILPEQLRAAPSDVAAVVRQADGLLVAAETAAAANDIGGALISLAQYDGLLQHAGALLTVAGARCGDPARAANAALNVPLRDVHHVGTGFGSVWASPWFGTAIQRVDPSSGDVLAYHRRRRSGTEDAARRRPHDRAYHRLLRGHRPGDQRRGGDPAQVRSRPVR